MRVVAWIVGVLLLLALLAYGVGAALPVGHTASVRARLPAPPDSVYHVLVDARRAPAWRSDVTAVEVLSEDPFRWRETGRFGTIGFVREVAEPPRRLAARIEEADGFGGRWTWVIGPDGSGSTVTVTEDGEVYSPVFRFASRFILGHYGTMERVLRDLGRRFGTEPELERVR